MILRRFPDRFPHCKHHIQPCRPKTSFDCIISGIMVVIAFKKLEKINCKRFQLVFKSFEVTYWTKTTLYALYGIILRDTKETRCTENLM